MGWRICDYCKGKKTVVMWDPKKKTYATVTCPACGGSGKVNTGLI